MEFTETEIPGVLIVQADVFPDDRGHFTAPWIRDSMAAHNLDTDLSQCGIAYNTVKGTLRGMHFQDEPFGQTKLVAALSGVVYDVAIDLRPESPAFRRWVGVELSADNNRALYVPIGCAHGYQTLTDSASVFYFVSRPYSAPHGRGVRWNDPAFGVSWPLGTPTKIHPRDANYPDFEY